MLVAVDEKTAKLWARVFSQSLQRFGVEPGPLRPHVQFGQREVQELQVRPGGARGGGGGGAGGP
jgi:hypothetical protein